MNQKTKWQQKQIGDVCEVQKGKTPRREWYADNGVQIIKFRDLTPAGIVWTNKHNGFVPDQYAPALKPLVVGMTLVGADAHNPEYIGKKVCFVDNLPSSPIFFSGELIAFSPKDNSVIDRRWLYFWLKSPSGYEAMQKQVVGMHLNSNPAKSILIPIPPLAEQKRIVQMLERQLVTVEKARIAAEKRLSEANALSAATLRAVFSPIKPLKWQQKQIGEVCNFQFGERITKSRDSGTKYPVYGGGGESFRTDNFNRQNEYVISRFAMSPQCVRFVSGKFWLLDSGGTFCIQPQYNGIVMKDFVNLLLLGMQKYIYAMSRGQGQQNLDVAKFKKMPIPLPPPEEQRRILNLLGQQLPVTGKVKVVAAAELDKINALPAAFLRAAFSVPSSVSET